MGVNTNSFTGDSHLCLEQGNIVIGSGQIV